MSQDLEIIKFELNKANFVHHAIHCWKVILPAGIQPTINICHNMRNINIPCILPDNLIDYFDSEKNPTASQAILYENNVALENKHNKIPDIIQNGKGRYSFWANTLYFSSMTNTPPTNNNNKYHVVIFTNNNITNEKFTFGINWLHYVSYCVNEQIVNEAGKYIDDWLNANHNLKDKTIIDIGCGSGLSSLCFIKRGAKQVISFDVDPNCILATKKLASIYYNNTVPDNWIISSGSITDDVLVGKLGQFDIVHSWGVLHHTGDMWKAVDNAIKLVKPGGLMLISLYSGIKTYENDKLMKETYNKSNKYGKINYIADYIMLIRHRRKSSGQDPHAWNTLQPTRGMRVYNDVVDWLGGLPYEVTNTAAITKFCDERGLKLLRFSDPPQKACHEWLFQKSL